MILLARTDPATLLRLAESATDAQTRLNSYYALANDRYFSPNSPAQRTAIPHARRAELLATIPDPGEREQALGILLNNWLRRDHDAARAWLDTHDAVSPETAAKILESADPLSPRFH